MRSLMIVEPDPSLDACPGFHHRLIGFEIDFLILQTAPQPLDEDIVRPAAFSIHADCNVGRVLVQSLLDIRD